MDHLRVNKVQGITSRILPPKLPTPEEIEPFAQTLREETIPAKLREFNDRADYLKEKRKFGLEKIEQEVRCGVFKNDRDPEFSQYFWTYWVNSEYSEIYLIQKWVKYYLRLLEMTTNVPIKELHVAEENGVDEEQIARAKEYPIENLYDGNLRHSFGKMVGPCPFHEEKTGSFTIYEDNHFYCFGCNTWGDAIDFYMKKNNVNMIDAVKALQNG